jgi:hypothetical protein
MVKGAQVNGSMVNKQQESANVLEIALAKA